VLLDGQLDPNDTAARHAMYETVTQAMSTTLANHNDVFLASLSNSLKESLGAGVQSRGPAYSNHNTGPRRSDATATKVTLGLSGQASGGVPIQQGGVSAQQGGNG
jgi:multimeric flavodoxin WrbA